LDVNGTRYQLLLGEDDWRNCTDALGVPLRLSWKRAQPDANSTKLAPASNSSQLAWDSRRNELTFQPRLFRFTPAQDDQPPTLERRRGAARDRYDNWYWIDETRARIVVRSSGSQKVAEFWSASLSALRSARRVDEEDDGAFRVKEERAVPSFVFAGLTVTEDHYLVVGTIEPKGILIFDLHAGGSPEHRLFPRGVEFEPFDMAARAGGGVFILDRRNRRYWELDRAFAVVNRAAPRADAPPPEDFHAAIDEAKTRAASDAANDADAVESARVAAPQITRESATPIFNSNPLAIESLPDGSVLILDHRVKEQFSRVRHYRDGRNVGESISTRVMLAIIEREQQTGFRLVAYDFAFVAGRAASGADEGTPDRLYIAAADGDQAYAFRLSWRGHKQIRLEPEAIYLPMRLFGGKGLVAASPQGAHYDFGDRFIPLTEQRRPRYVESATLLTPVKSQSASEPDRVFDGGEPDCVWHRLMLDACIPAGTNIEVWSRAANDEDDLLIASWDREPTLHLRPDGSELPFAGRLDKRTDAAVKARAKGDGTWELLFQRARGRYLQLMLVATGDGRTTPRLRALRAYYPRFSYSVNYLPSVYREDEQSASFLERFLANFEGTLTALEDKIAAVQLLFDVQSAPAEALEWLANWYGVALDPAWDEARRRIFIKHAMDFFAYRGTRRGLELALRLVFDECIDDSAFSDDPREEARRDARGIRLVERYRARSTPAALVGDPTEAETPGFAPADAGLSRKLAPLALQLSDDFRAKLGLSGVEEFPITNPGGESGRAWKSYAQSALGFVPSATGESDADAWRDFLARRYRTVRALNDAHRSAWSSFADVTLPASLPRQGVLFRDWYEFESIVVQMRRTAHRFTVLLPVPRTDTFGNAEQEARRALAERIVALEKPAHTKFDIKFYWAMFRIGETRLGEDTLLDFGSRAIALAPPVVLGTEHLAESRLAPTHPQDVTDRTVIGRGSC
jgi:phage tail-like protein